MVDKRSEQFIKMSETPVERLILTLAIPSVINMLVTNIYNMVDTAFVGKLGTSASGAIGIVFGFMSIIQAIGFMYGQGAGSISARLLGAQNDKKASEVASGAFFSSFGIGILIAVFSFLMLDDLVMWLGATSTIAPYAKGYVGFILLAAPAMCACFTMNNILRYEGKALIGMIGMVTGAVLNIFGDAFFIFKCDMGIYGAGLSTCISQYVSFCILLFMFVTGQTVCKLKFSLSLKGIKNLPDVMATGFPSLLRQGLNSVATVFLNFMAAPFGDEAVAAFSIVSRITFFVFSIGLGIGQGYQPVSAFNYGAGKYSRIRKGFRFTFGISQVLLMIIGFFVVIFNKSVLGVFTHDTRVIEIASRALVLQCISLVVMPFCVTVEMQLQSTGRKIGASILSSCRGGIFLLPVLYVLTQLRGVAGIQEAQPIATVLGLFPALILGRKFFADLPQKDL